jgi:hypothetical protein
MSDAWATIAYGGALLVVDVAGAAVIGWALREVLRGCKGGR